MCSIFQELQIVHDTGYFSALPSLEEYWQQVKRGGGGEIEEKKMMRGVIVALAGISAFLPFKTTHTHKKHRCKKEIIIFFVLPGEEACS